MAIHRDLPSAEVHEPKHFSTSTIADAGKVLTPSFSTNGISVLRNLTPDEVGISIVYGEAALDANTSSFSVSAATDDTLYTVEDYVQLDSARVPDVYLDHNNNVTFNSVQNSISPSETGDYRISFWMNIATDTNNSKVGVKAKQNGDWANFTVKHDIKEAGRTETLFGSIITDLTAASEVSLWIASDKAANITIQDMRFYIELLRRD